MTSGFGAFFISHMSWVLVSALWIIMVFEQNTHIEIQCSFTDHLSLSLILSPAHILYIAWKVLR